MPPGKLALMAFRLPSGSFRAARAECHRAALGQHGCSNPQALEAMVLAAQVIKSIKIAKGAIYVPTPARRWRLLDRLGEQVIRELLADRRCGMSQQPGLT